MQDWMERSIKTFVQTFCGIVITGGCAILKVGFPESWSVFWAALAPVIASALSAAICAAWNIILEKLKEEGKP